MRPAATCALRPFPPRAGGGRGGAAARRPVIVLAECTRGTFPPTPTAHRCTATSSCGKGVNPCGDIGYRQARPRGGRSHRLASGDRVASGVRRVGEGVASAAAAPRLPAGSAGCASGHLRLACCALPAHPAGLMRRGCAGAARGSIPPPPARAAPRHRDSVISTCGGWRLRVGMLAGAGGVALLLCLPHLPTARRPPLAPSRQPAAA